MNDRLPPPAAALRTQDFSPAPVSLPHGLGCAPYTPAFPRALLNPHTPRQATDSSLLDVGYQWTSAYLPTCLQLTISPHPTRYLSVIRVTRPPHFSSSLFFPGPWGSSPPLPVPMALSPYSRPRCAIPSLTPSFSHSLSVLPATSSGKKPLPPIHCNIAAYCRPPHIPLAGPSTGYRFVTHRRWLPVPGGLVSASAARTCFRPVSVVE